MPSGELLTLPGAFQGTGEGRSHQVFTLQYLCNYTLNKFSFLGITPGITYDRRASDIPSLTPSPSLSPSPSPSLTPHPLFLDWLQHTHYNIMLPQDGGQLLYLPKRTYILLCLTTL